MSDKTFAYDVTYKANTAVFGEGDNVTYEMVKVTKTVKFKELDQYDREQHSLHFLIMGHMLSGGTKKKSKKQLFMDPEFSLEVTTIFIEEMAVTDDKNFTERDREILLDDSAALIALSLYLIPQKVIPFFLELMKGTGK